ncbi:hypothetical protein [Rhodoblastus sp.]|uniref:hypothetical protein n=1 Tax=Rhodoblastus sp. TaxID=1962975 RepID=UPI003F9E801C
MSIRSALLLAGALAFLGAGSANAESVMKQCSTKYKAAKASNQLGNTTWLQFLSQCRTDLKAGGAAPAAAPAAAAPAPAPAPAAAAAPAPAPMPAATAAPAKRARAPAPVATGPVMFPTAVSPTYSKESAGKARMHTCLDQYKANKATGGNGGLKWIEKGGGYYSECNTKLKQ